jgi:hypothetical protein
VKERRKGIQSSPGENGSLILLLIFHIVANVILRATEIDIWERLVTAELKECLRLEQETWKAYWQGVKRAVTSRFPILNLSLCLS